MSVFMHHGTYFPPMDPRVTGKPGMVAGRTGKADPGYKLCVSIGKALEMPPESIFRVAGLLPAYPDIDEKIKQILDDVAKLPENDKKEVLAFILMKPRLLEKRGQKPAKGGPGYS
jgi:hypothetical protein